MSRLINAIKKIAEQGKIFRETATEESAAQRPAAYRFALRSGRVDIIPETLKSVNSELVRDTFDELQAKAKTLHARLLRTNSAQRVCRSVEQLLSALESKFEELRPGILLSKSRSIEADRNSYTNDTYFQMLYR